MLRDVWLLPESLPVPWWDWAAVILIILYTVWIVIKNG